MNVYEAMRIIVRDCIGKHADLQIALEEIEEMVSAYDTLAPDWTQAPDWAQWMTLFDNGKLVWWEYEPIAFIDSKENYALREINGRIGMITSEMTSLPPLGIDWRLCKWQRPEAQS